MSFVVPVLNEHERIVDLLCALRNQFPGAELIVVDGGSTDDTVTAAMAVCDLLLCGQRGRARQLNLGANAARGDYVCFLHADSLPTFDNEQLQTQLQGAPPWGFCRVGLDGARGVFRVIEWFINLRSSLSGVGTGDQMLFVRRDVFAATGGFDDMPLMEDVAFCKRLLAIARPRVIKLPVITSSRRWERGGVIQTVMLMWALRLGFFLGVSPARLAQHYRDH